ncbi:DUF421 domain-containing protein [Nonomuraea harbinensis]|uniref:DUF421 domain-containing protein n=1 Tax=Nonomuraea harbinensis TaxID=1286938 RepID=A0ABW1BNM0_9ACTN|nr:YetF domain-containing protein [Nonomuraea harbinensis]
MPDWEAVFLPTTPPAELVVRGTVTFLMLLVLIRVTGQRESGGLGITDVLLVVLVAQAAAGGLAGDSHSIADGFVLVVTILVWSVVLDAVAYRWPRAAAVLKARPQPLIKDGRLNPRVMRREFMTREEVFSQLRLHGIRDLGQVSRAYLEPNGMISVIRHDDTGTDPPPAPKMLG